MNTGNYTHGKVITAIITVKGERYAVNNVYEKGAEFMFFGERQNGPKFGIIEFVDNEWYINDFYKAYFYPDIPWGTFRIIKKLELGEVFETNYTR